MDKKGKKIEKISFVVLIILIVGLATVLYLRRNQITNVNKVLSNKYDKIECIDKNCDYLKVFSKEKNMYYIYDSFGVRLSKYENSNSKMLYDVTSQYLLFKDVSDEGKIRKYYVTKLNGKKVYDSTTELNVLTDYLITERNGEITKVINYKGDVLYENITSLKRYKNVSAIVIQEKESLIDERGDIVLSNYTVEKEVYDYDDEDELLYIIIKDDSNAFYYFDVNTDKIKGSEFVKYEEPDEDNIVVIYKKSNGKTEKYELDEYGDTKEDLEQLQLKTVKKIKKKVPKDYDVYSGSLFSEYQEKVLVDNKKDNSFGIYNIKTKKYKKIYSYTVENGSSIVFNFDSYDGNKYLQISCQAAYCGIDKVTVYDVNNSKVLFEYNHGDNKIKDFTGIRGGYKLVKYTSDSTEEFADKYILYNKKNEVVVSSKNMITVVDRRVVYGKKYKDAASSIIYSAKLKKVLNDDDTLAEIKKVNKNRIYKYEKDDKTYFVSNKGDELFNIENSKSNIMYSKNVILNVSDKNVKIIDAKNNKVGSYKLEKNESVLNSNDSLVSYKNSIFVNNETSNYGKIVDYSGTKIKKIKKSTISAVKSSKKSDNIIIITTANDKYGFYIAK